MPDQRTAFLNLESILPTVPLSDITGGNNIRLHAASSGATKDFKLSLTSLRPVNTLPHNHNMFADHILQSTAWIREFDVISWLNIHKTHQHSDTIMPQCTGTNKAELRLTVFVHFS